MNDWIEAFDRLLTAFDRLGIPHLIGGSLASSAVGIWRATQDIDIVADLTTDAIDRLAPTLGNDFYADREAMREALERGRPFNIIHYATSFKFDVFPLPEDVYYHTEFSRRVRTAIQMGKERVLSFWAATPEDVILTKLVWYQGGGCVSDRQWSDIRGVIAVQGERLDMEYLRRWATHLNAGALLDRAFEE